MIDLKTLLTTGRKLGATLNNSMSDLTFDPRVKVKHGSMSSNLNMNANNFLKFKICITFVLTTYRKLGQVTEIFIYKILHLAPGSRLKVNYYILDHLFKEMDMESRYGVLYTK